MVSRLHLYFGKCARSVALAAVIGGVATVAHASSVQTLPDVEVDGYASAAYASNYVTLSTLGTASLPSDTYGTATLTATGGQQPGVSVSFSPHPGDIYGTTGGNAHVNMGYYVEYVGTSPGTTIGATIHSSDTISVNGSLTAFATMRFNGGQIAYECVSGAGSSQSCGSAHPSYDGAPFGDFDVSMVEGAIYKVVLTTYIQGFYGPASITIDPYFTTAATDGNFIFSSGIEPFAAATPLPATLPMFVSGLGAVGALVWRRKRKA